jgi:hypothetical protein
MDDIVKTAATTEATGARIAATGARDPGCCDSWPLGCQASGALT